MESAIERIGSGLLSIGRFTYGHEQMIVMQWGGKTSLTIGSFCALAPGVTFFLGGNHRVDWITTFPFGHVFKDELGIFDIQGHPQTKGDVVVGHDVWIGNGVTIMSGVTIGSGAVLAAKSVITKNVAPYEIVGGNPARHLKFRFDPEIVTLLLRLRWWDLPLEEIKDIAKMISTQPSVEMCEYMLKRYRGCASA